MRSSLALIKKIDDRTMESPNVEGNILVLFNYEILRRASRVEKVDEYDRQAFAWELYNVGGIGMCILHTSWQYLSFILGTEYELNKSTRIS